MDDFERDIDKDYELMKKSFTKFEWKLEKHIFSEEKVIFTNYNPEDITEGYQMLPELTKQHNFILNQLSNWRKELVNKNKIDGFYKFKKVLINHKIFEENEVYPKLDQSLSDSDKKLIIGRLNEIN
ncbi:hemerythrin domain-containing protein [Thermoplasmatota archaeon]